ncbi:MAG: repeat containing protein [Cyanobacteria bacterium RYN_339]|nr:repeat containing protein [Cyanobacteria bacterium RYN_339]
MPRSLARWRLAVVVCLVAGCAPAPGTVRKAPVAVAAKASVEPSAPPTVVATAAPAPLVAATPGPAAGIVSNNSGSLLGHVRVPATLLANNGASLRLLAVPDERPAANVTVRLEDAAGQPLLGADGQPVAALTDAAGAYRLADVPAERAWVVRAELPGHGAVRALALPDAANRQALDLDFVTTLATVYVLEKYVGTQADRVATLRKLPATAEAETRARTTAALAGASVAVPDRLDASAVLAAVESLRSGNQALDAQWEAVRRLLIPAGLSDLGAGRLGTEVGLADVSGLTPLPDGGLLIAAEGDRRAWRLGPDGRITTFAGGGVPEGGAIDGAVAATAGLTAPTGAVVDAAGRVVLLEKAYAQYPFDRVNRIGPDGKLHELCHDTDTGVAAVPSTGDEVLVVRTERGSRLPELVAIGADLKVRKVAPIAVERQYMLRNCTRYGRDAQGRIWIGSDDIWSTPKEGLVVYTIDPASGAMTRMASAADEGLQGLSVDSLGNVFVVDAQGRLQVRPPQGPARVLLDKWPPDAKLAMDGVALMPDGSAYVARDGKAVYRVAANALTLVAGNPAASTSATTLALAEPSGVAPIAAGGLYVADAGLHRIVRIDAAGKVSPYAGTGAVGDEATTVDRPVALHLDGAGNLYFLDVRDYARYLLRRVTHAGKLETVYASDRALSDLAVTRDGTAYFSDYISRGFFDDHAQLQRLVPGGKPEVLIPEAYGFGNQLSLALGPDETIYLLNGGSQVFAWFAGDVGVKKATVGNGTGFMANDDGGFAIDARNRFYFADKDNHVVIRWDPALKAFETVAGKGGKRFTGDGVDDGLLGPAYLAFGATGDLFIADVGHKQVKRIAAADL